MLSFGAFVIMPLQWVRADAPAPPRLSVQTDEQSPAPPSETAQFHFGSRSVLDTSPITHTFVLRSSTGKSITIDRLQPSCRCTTAVVEGVKDEAPPFTLAPGQQARVRVIISPGDALPGPFEKEVYVFAAGDSVPTATLQMAGELTAPVLFEPAVLNFGRLSGPNVRPLSVTITVDNRLLPPDRTVLLRCDNADIKLMRLPSLKPNNTTDSTVAIYQITLSPHAHKGALHASLSVATSAGLTPVLGTDAWGTASVTGEIVGSH